MKSLLLDLILVFSFTSQALEGVNQVKQNLSYAHQEFQELGVDLPFGRVYFAWKDKIREVYKQAGRDLLQAAILEWCYAFQSNMGRLRARCAEVLQKHRARVWPLCLGFL